MTLDTAGRPTAAPANPRLNESLAAIDPAVHSAIADELARQQNTLEMIASENFAPLAVMQAQGSVLTNKYAEGYPGPPLLRRLRARRRHRAARDRPGQGPVRRRVRQRAAAFRRAGQRRGHGSPAQARRHDPRAGPRPRRPPHPRHAAQLLRAAVQRRRLPRLARTTHRVDMDEVERLAREHRPQLIIAGWSAYPRQLDFAEFRRIADEVGAYLHGRHGALRRPGRRRPAPLPGAARARRHLHHPQDPRRPPRRRHPDQRPRRWPRSSTPRCSPASRAVRSSTSSPPRRWRSRSPPSPRSASARSAPSPAPGSSPTGCCRRRRARPGSTCVTGGTDVHLVLVDLRESELDGKQAEDRLHCGRASPSTATPCRSTRGRRWSAPACASAPRRWPPAASTLDDFAEVADIIAAALRPDDRRRRPRGPARPGRRARRHASRSTRP